MPNPSLAGRRILITGATSGLGATMAVSLAVEHGAHVIAIGRREDQLLELTRQISSATTAGGSSIETHALSLTNADAVDALCAQLAGDGVDDLILNAGITSVGPFENGAFDTDQAVVATNVSANLQLIRRLIPVLENDNTGGRIMLIASLGGLVPMPYQAVYAGSKAFLINFAASLREELKPAGICVLTFAPGGIATAMTDIDEMADLKSQLAPVAEVAVDAIAAFINRKPITVPGAGNKLLALLARALPRTWLAAGAERIYRRARTPRQS